MTHGDSYFKIFCKIIKTIQNSTDREEILKLIVDSAIEAMDGKACSLFLIKSRADEDGLFYPAAMTGLSDSYVHSGPAKGRNITRDILMKGGFLAARDATSDPRLENHQAKKEEGIASLLVVPVIAEKDPIGILVLYTSDHRDFSQEDIDFLRGLADQGGIAILRAHKDYRIKRDLDLFVSISELLGSSLDITKILHIMTSEISQQFDLLGVTIRLQEEQSDELKLIASYGLSERYLNKGSVCAHRIKTVIKGNAEVVDDIHTYDIDYKVERKAEGIISMLHLPIMVQGRPIGIMGLYSDKRRAISDDDVSLMSGVARQCGLAIHNASLYLQITEDKKSLEDEIWAHRAWF